MRAGEPEDFHAGGSDCSGIVWALGRDVRTSGSATRWSYTAAGGVPTTLGALGQRTRCSPRARASGATRPTTGASASSRAPGHQCVPKPKRLTWEEGGLLPAVCLDRLPDAHGAAASRGRAGDVVLVWGAAAGSAAWRSRSRARRRARGRDHFRRRKRKFCRSMAPRRSSTGASSPTGSHASTEDAERPTASGRRRPRVRQGHLGRDGRARTPSSSSSPGRIDAADVGLRLRDRRHGRSSAPAPPATTRRWISGISGCARSVPGQPPLPRRPERPRHEARQRRQGPIRASAATYVFDDIPECHS